MAISLYRGNLHRVPDVPRRWLMPDRNLSPKDFKSLLHRRSRALSRAPSASIPPAAPDLGSGAGLLDDGRPPLEPEAERGAPDLGSCPGLPSDGRPPLEPKAEKGSVEVRGEGTSKGGVALKEEVDDHREAVDVANRSPEAKPDWAGKSVDGGGGVQVLPAEKVEEPAKDAVQVREFSFGY